MAGRDTLARNSARKAAASAKTANEGVAPYGFGAQVETYLPKFTKLNGQPIFTAAMSGKSSIYWFRVIKVDGLIPNALGKYYATFSTNHNARGGIGLAYADDPKGPFKNYGEIYVDTVVGDSTETPFVIYNEKERLFYMYYQQSGAGINQSTLLATSPNMINWTRIGIVLDKPDGYPGDGHTGYFAVFKFAEKWIGYSVMGGGDYGRKVISYSNDGKFWYSDPRAMLGGNDATLSYGENFSRSNAGLFMYRGQMWWLGMMSAYASGGVTTVARPAIARISPDLRQLLHRPIDLVPFPTLPWETTNMQSMMVSVLDGNIYVYYNTDNNVGLVHTEVA